MRRVGLEGSSIAAAALLLLSPAALIFCMPLTIGRGLDIFALGNEAPLALALCVPAILTLAQCVAARCVAARRQCEE